MYRVEFIGVPGSGKTTVRNRLIERFKSVDSKRYLSVEKAILEVSKKRIDHVFRIVLNLLPGSFALKMSNKLLNRNLMQYDAQNRFLAEHGKALEFFFNSSAFEKMPINDRGLPISSFLETGSLYECLNQWLPGEKVVFFEEGFIQKSFMFISPHDSEYRDEPYLSSYMHSIPLPDLTVYVQADLEACYKRMISRPDGLTKRLRHIDKDGILKFLEVSDRHLRHVAKWLKENKNINLFVVDNTLALDDAVSDLEQKMKTLF